MALHLPGKVSKLISDFLTIAALVDIIEHEMEKRIVARHGLVKLDSILDLLPRYKNELKAALPTGNQAVISLEALIATLRKDYQNSELEVGRDAMSAHALNLDLYRILAVWSHLNGTIFSVLSDDLKAIDAALASLDVMYPVSAVWYFEDNLPFHWRRPELLGDPKVPRMATIYGGFATAGIVSAMPGGHPVQDAVIRVAGLMTFLHQTHRLSQPVHPGSEVDRLFCEIALNDYCSLWDALFTSGLRNDYGQVEPSLLDQWRTDGWDGMQTLETLEQQPHPKLHVWRQQVRNKISAHVDAEIPIFECDLTRWPMTRDELMEDVYRVINAVHSCSRNEIRAKLFFMPPHPFPDSSGLSAQEGLHWNEG